MADHKTLTEALAAVQANLPHIRKADKADTGKYSYTYASLTDVSVQLLPLLAEHGLAFTALPAVTDTGFELRFELRHVSGDALSGSWPLPMQGGAQVQGSAITYARRYALLAVTGAAPDDDDDGQAASTAKTSTAKPATTKPSQPVDLFALEELIQTAIDAGIEKDWDKLRQFAAQSDDHRDKACDRVSRALDDA